MTLLGLHWIDVLIVLAYVMAVLAIGQHLSKKVHGESDFFLAGRTLGKWFQFFLNFGNMAGDPSAAAVTAASVYSQGVGGVWLGLVNLFITPYYWFMNPWFRRVRLTTIADLFQDRFDTRFLATLYAVVSILLAPLGIGFANVIAFKTLEPIMVKPPATYTEADRQNVQDYARYRQLHQEKEQGAPFTGPEETEYAALQGRHARGELQSYISYLQPLPFYLCTSLLVCVFIVLGGLKASAIVDAIQAVMVLGISVVLIPFGLARIGGLHGLHQAVPDAMFQLFGSEATSEYSWSSIAAFLLLGFIGITAAPGNMNIAGSAKDEMAARMGALGGGFAKRLVTIGWCFCGLIAVALFGPNMADPDQTWGILTRALLPVGLIGLMLVGMLGGKLAALGAASVVLSALAVKNMYEPLFPGKSERHYMAVARLTTPVILLLGVGVALYLNNVLSLAKTIAALAVTWGAPILLIFLWRRLTESAVRFQVIASLLLIGVLPVLVPAIPALRQAPRLTVLTEERTVPVTVRANRDDVAAGLASRPGEPLVREHHIESSAIFFEDGVAPIDRRDPDSAKEGVGRFNIEVFLISLFGVKVAGWSPAALLTARYLVDSLLPFLILLVGSRLTRPASPERVARFYARLKTPVAPTPEEDAREVEKSYANPARFDHRKLFPGSQWELMKWTRLDAIGFGACCGIVGLIVAFFEGMLALGR